MYVIVYEPTVPVSTVPDVLTEVEEIQEVTVEIPIEIEIEQTNTVITTQTAAGS